MTFDKYHEPMREDYKAGIITIYTSVITGITSFFIS